MYSVSPEFRKGTDVISPFTRWAFIHVFSLFLIFSQARSQVQSKAITDLGLSAKHYQPCKTPENWHLRKRFFGPTKNASAQWVVEDGVEAVKLYSRAALTFLEKPVKINIKEFPIVTWRWKVEDILEGVAERTVQGDDHPIRIFFVFEPDTLEQSWWFRLKRFLYLDWYHGHPVGGRFMEYLWSSHLKKGEIIRDPRKPKQKLMVIEGGRNHLGKWLSYERNLYEDFTMLYNEEPRKLIFIGILNDTDQTGQEATSYIADLKMGPRLSRHSVRALPVKKMKAIEYEQ